MRISAYDVAKYLSEADNEDYITSFAILDKMLHGDITQGISNEEIRNINIERIIKDIQTKLKDCIIEMDENNLSKE